MKVGDYVRTRDGDIGKTFEKYKGVEGATIYKIDKSTEDFDYTNVFDWEIEKSSPNIIDLIEVGDYVNGTIVTKVVLDEIECKYIELDYSYNKRGIREKDIKSIVTKEQFESMEYKVKE